MRKSLFPLEYGFLLIVVVCLLISWHLWSFDDVNPMSGDSRSKPQAQPPAVPASTSSRTRDIKAQMLYSTERHETHETPVHAPSPTPTSESTLYTSTIRTSSTSSSSSLAQPAQHSSSSSQTPVPTTPTDGAFYISTNPHAHIDDPETSPLPSADDSSDALSQTRPIAVVIESEMTPNLIPIMLHFATVLGPIWTIMLFTLEASWEEPDSPAFLRAIADGRFEVRFLPPETILKNSASVSQFLAKPWLWEQVQEAHRILLFQTDSIICSKSPIAVEDFFEYDFVGAPIAQQYGEGYNGGLSIRNPKLFLNITKEVDFVTSGSEFEDQWFYQEAKARVASQRVKLAPVDVAKTFSVETIYYEKPLGYHQPERWNAGRMPEIEEWCPEVKMLVGRRAT
ncbi:hypothetical protein QBC46DRAFT_132181 [Diplogelasinospora grovesii]|uniref:DUF5672 domain-containing protein n=1 Tax=Diplogelasinospora grovesii TaxID=303347 RepID=A0AAN6S9I7_9PEZI|nr:hypothetical protein QBC46DRAFT_132181 [Diplogelasinospora grovesii]